MSDRLPDDRIVEIASYKRAKIYGIGKHRASVQPDRTGYRWAWRAWDVLHPDLGGSGLSETGVAKTKGGAMEAALDILRKVYGIEQVAEGQ